MDDKAYPPVDTQALLDALPDPTAVVDAAGTLVLVNAAWSASGGHGYFGAIGRPGDDYLELCERGWSDDTAPARVVARGLRAVLAGQRAEFAHEYLVGELGEQRWYRARAARLPDTGPVRALVSHASFDGDKQIDARARLSELTHRTLVEHLPLVIYIYALEPASHTLYVSPQIEAMLGFEQAEWMADPGLWLRQVHPDDRATMEANLERSRAAGASILSEYRMLARDGRVVWVRYEAAIVRDKAGLPLFVRGIAQDITARKQAEEDLRDREARLRLLAEQLPAVVWSTDTALRFTSGQGRGLLALDIRPEEPIGRVLMDYQGSPEAAAIALAAHQRALQGEAVSYELETRGRVFQAHVAPARDAAGAIVGVIGVAIDITHSKELRAALTANQLRLQALFDNAEDAFLLFDDQARCVDANPSELRLTGYEYEELRQLTIADLILVHQATWFENTWQTFLSAGRLTGEVALRRKDGSAIEVEYRAVANIVPGLHLSIMRDISERRRAETDLRRSEERFRALIENASDAIALASLAGVVLYVSPAASRILGYAIEELIGASTAALLHPDDRQAAEDLLAQLREHPERVVTIEQRIRRKDGSWCWIEAKVANLLDNPSVGAIVSNYRDISQRKRAERERDDLLEQLRAANDRLRGLSRQLVEAQELERRQIARDLHDQIGQNLAVLNVNIAVARDQLSKESAARVDKQLGYAQQLVDETVEHIRDVLAELRPSELDDYGLAAALRWYVPHVAKRAGFTALLAIREPERRLPPAAEIALFRVVQEALTNVAKHARARRVSVSLETDGPVLYLVVADDGIGFDVDAPGRRGERHGFGLTGMRERVEAVSGRLWIESGPGHGTRVIVELMVQFDHD